MTQDATSQSARRERIGNALRQLREERGWSQTRLAEHCSSRSSLAAYEAGQSEPQVSTLLEILEALGFELRDFADALDRVEGKAPADDEQSASDVRVRRRAWMLVDLSEEEVPHSLEQNLADWEDLIEHLTAFTYRHGAAEAAERRKAERREAREGESSDKAKDLKTPRKAAEGS